MSCDLYNPCHTCAVTNAGTTRKPVESSDTPGAIFARRLREERARAGLTQTDVARQLSERTGTKIDSSALTRVEKGQRAVKLEEALALAEILGEPLDTLLHDEPEDERRLADLEHELVEAQWRASAIEDQLRQARASVVAIEAEIEALRTSQEE